MQILLDYEWVLLNKLIDIFKPIEEATEWLVLDNGNITIDKDSEDNKSLSNNKSDKVDDHKYIFTNNIQIPLSEINTIINFVKKSIYDVLFDYFNFSPKIVILASLLDSRFKKMREWSEEVCKMVIFSLKREYQLLKNEETAVSQKIQKIII
ncbi:18474_t:CDS:2 [Funneliformis geosporum]|nr:18474_t:CDS:2 [Funneliformis geosporum]